MKPEYLFQTFFGSQDEKCQFTAKGQRLAMQVLQIFEHQSHNNAKSVSPTYQVTENDVKSIKTKFNTILCMVEDAKEALMTIGTAEDHGICTEDDGIPEDTSRTNGIWDLIGILVKASIGVALLDACWNPLLAAAIRTLVIGGSAIAAAIAAWRLSFDDDHGNGCSDDEWNFREAFVTYVQVIGGYVLLLALIHPIAVVSGIITLVFFGLLAFFGGITLWETYFGNSETVEDDDIFAIKDNFIKELSLTSWFVSANQLSTAIEDATLHIVYLQSLNIAYALLLKVRETMTFEEWLNKYLNSTNSFYKLIERKYGSTLAPVVVAFVLVVLIFDDHNRSLMDSVFKSRHFEKSIKPQLDAKIFRSNFVSFVADLNNVQKEITKNFYERLDTQRERNSHRSIIITPITLDNKERNFNDSEDLIKSDGDINSIEFAGQDGLKTMSSFMDVQKNNTADNQKYESKSLELEISDKGKTHNTIESQSNDLRKHRKAKYSEFKIKNPLAYNRLKVRHEPQTDMEFVENEPDLYTNYGYTDPIKVLQNEADKNEIFAQKENLNSPLEEFKSTKKLLLPNPEKQVLVDVESHKIPAIIGSNEKMTILRELEKRVESLLDNGTTKIPEIIGSNEKMTILRELEKRVESLLDNGTTKNLWLVDLEKRFEKIFF
ncbi:hypothetical protein JTE90_009796 [Oedothorax gibbosus]|uniref:Uncharacterized protein n=1 Tax=Oedothorax gibbosus TaxID=931172 RepID=A0AAV6UQZ4_9ARAC|nr:hypothetical protein JTE90_009796 [Oedothorax gibbosus]